MNRTTAQALDQRSETQRDIFPCTAIVVGVDYLARQVAVNIRGRSGPRAVRVAQSIALGTASKPNVVVGTRVMVNRLEDSYIVVATL